MTAALLVGFLLAQGGFCGTTRAVAEALKQAGEVMIGQGVSQSRGSIVQVWASRDGGWTLIAALPDGRSCLLASGSSWESSPSALVPERRG